jgi:hypothetical protein
MSNDDEYRRQAAAAEKQARLAKFESDRESWLRIAQGWLSLLSMRPQSEDEAFSAQSKADGTGQDGSESSWRPFISGRPERIVLPMPGVSTERLSCPKCGLRYLATREWSPETVGGRFECIRCFAEVHSWSGDQDYSGWLPMKDSD